MKKTLLALVVAAAATSVNAAEIYKSEDGSVNFYGQLRTELKVSDDSVEYAYNPTTDMFEGEKVEGKTTLGAGSSRAGVDARYAINDNLDILGKIEFSISTDEMKVRNHIFGFAGDFGTIKFGEQWTVADDVYGADYSYFFGGSALGYGLLNGAAHDSMIKYNYDAENFFIAANYGLDEDKSNQEVAEIFVGGSFGDLSAHVGFGQTTDETDMTEDKTEDTFYEVTLEYSFGDAGIGFTYYNTEIKNSDHKVTIDGFSLAGTYAWADNATAYAGYEYTDQDTGSINVSGDFGKEDTSTVVYVGTDYHFNSWSRIYVEAAYQDGRTLGFTNKASDSFVDEPTIVDGGFAFGTGVRVYW